MKYLKSKPGSLEATAGQVSGFATEQEYQKMFKKELDKAGKGIGSMSPKEKKDFFNKIDSKYKAKDEGFASDAQRKAAFASGYKAKDKKEDLDNKDKSVVKDVVSALKKATKAHDGQAKDLEKAMKTEADQHGDEINDKKVKASMTKGEKKPQKLHADSGSKLTKVETEPKVDYKN